MAGELAFGHPLLEARLSMCKHGRLPTSSQFRANCAQRGSSRHWRCGPASPPCASPRSPGYCGTRASFCCYPWMRDASSWRRDVICNTSRPTRPSGHHGSLPCLGQTPYANVHTRYSGQRAVKPAAHSHVRTLEWGSRMLLFSSSESGDTTEPRALCLPPPSGRLAFTSRGRDLDPSMRGRARPCNIRAIASESTRFRSSRPCSVVTMFGLPKTHPREVEQPWKRLCLVRAPIDIKPKPAAKGASLLGWRAVRDGAVLFAEDIC